MTTRIKYIILNAIALSISIVPPVVTTLMQFPIWIESSAEATLSGTVCLIVFVCCIPFYKQIINYMKSPSVPVVWILIAAAMYIFKEIADQLFIVACVGAVSNLIGMLFFKWRDFYKEREK